MALETIHFRYLKDYIDQLIINKGVIYVKSPELVIEKMKIDFLVKLAFRFYSILYSSDKYASYIKAGEKEEMIDSEKDYQPILKEIFHQINLSDSDHKVSCLNCKCEIPLADIVVKGDNLPVCNECLHEISLEMDLWEKVYNP